MGSFDSGFWNELDDHWKEGGEEEADEQEFSLLPEGSYDVRIAKWHFMESADKKTPGMNVEFDVIGQGNRKLWHTFWLTPANLPYVLRDVRVITGNRVTKPSDLQDVNFEGCVVNVAVKHETYNEKERSNIKSFKTASVQAVEGESSGEGEPSF